jgi:hypothetical protein
VTEADTDGVGKKGRRGWLWGLVVCVGAVLFWAAYQVSFTVRAPVRWALHRSEFKARVESLPEPPNGELKHLDWDGWGFTGMDTEVYLVFDPGESLAALASSHRSGKVAGVPCEFWYARRLEKNWYAVVFFTDQGWGDCGV